MSFFETRTILAGSPITAIRGETLEACAMALATCKTEPGSETGYKKFILLRELNSEDPWSIFLASYDPDGDGGVTVERMNND
ncbi:hypothetical protein [Novipirellula artificiosorum]|uniref:Uncharacterized protein n=1 Tax=Novipirellula artificiosorum TaxID=2528016 RepID=A0A5C6DR95_9BACT|nr:hypothetical protein [Novipirellula artificiosorum]TWU37279.1 hypothetical protein Poly41_34080 [Novipirellula artificiosorum]